MKPAFLLLLLSLSPQSLAAERLTLGQYLAQVEGGNPSVAAARLEGEGGYRRAEGASILTFPYLFGTASGYKDQSEGAYPSMSGTETTGNAYTFGLGMNSPIGLNGKYSWNSAYANTAGITFPTAGKYTSYNKLDLTLNLARNGFGSEVRAKKELLRAGNTAEALAGKFEYVGRMSEAENAYWRLAFARQSVQVQKDVLARAEKLLQWARRRVGLQLGDKSDLLQAQASYDLHSLELTNALEEEKGSARAFNLLRSLPGESVPEAVALPSIEETLKMPAPERKGARLDLQAAEERTKAKQAQAQLDKENLKPSIDLIGAYSWNGREAERKDAVREAFGNHHPSKSIGLTFTVPLNAPQWVSALKGANQEIEAAGLELEHSRNSEAKEWSDLSARLVNARARLKLANTVESVQREKFENERQRLLRGRTTTYQAVTFEQDYAQSQLLRLRTQAEVLQLIAQLKTFRGEE
ncbi:MAG TPA: TolC family protein [Bdellovibrionota bacterium]|jgi:outer membrane protein TolC